PRGAGWHATGAVGSGSRRRSSTWPSTSPRTSRAGPTGHHSSSTAASRSTTSEGRMTDEAPEGASTDPLVDTGRDMASRGTLAVGVDVGGSGIKAAVVDTATGQLVSERLRVPTPTPSTPDRVSASIGRLVRRLAKADELERETPVGIGLPGGAIGGGLVTAANIDPAWIGYPIAERLSYLLKRRVEIVNDADAAGIAELRFGLAAGRPGTVIFLTLGTGVGSGVFVHGKLLPNTEFGQLELRGSPAERRSASAGSRRHRLSLYA